MIVLRRELQGGLRSLLIWVAILGLINALTAFIFPSFAAEAEQLDQLMKLFPPEMIKALGLDRISMADPMGWFATEMFLIIALAGSVYAALLGGGILAKEEDDRTIEFLLARPICRGRMLLQKIIAMILMLGALNLGLFVINAISYALFVEQEYAMGDMVRLSVAPLLLHLTFAGIAFLSALFWSRRRAVYGVSIGIAIGTYFVGMISSLADRLAWLRWLSPYRYVDAVDILLDGRLQPMHVLALLAVSLSALALTYGIYRRRDITI